MATIVQNLEILIQTKNNIKAALASKGVEAEMRAQEELLDEL